MARGGRERDNGRERDAAAAPRHPGREVRGVRGEG